MPDNAPGSAPSPPPLAAALGQRLALHSPAPGPAPAAALQNTVLSCLLSSYRPSGRGFFALENQFGCRGVVLVHRRAPAPPDALPGPGGPFQAAAAVPSPCLLREAMEQRSAFPQRVLSPLDSCLSAADLRAFPPFCRFTQEQIARFRGLWSGRLYALDCEMVKTQRRSAQLGSVSVYDQDRQRAFSSYCRPDAGDRVVDCLTRYSGILPAHIAGAGLTAAGIGAALFRLFLVREGGAGDALGEEDVGLVYSAFAEAGGDAEADGNAPAASAPAAALRFSWEGPAPAPAPPPPPSPRPSIDALLDACERAGVRFTIVVGHAISNDLAALRFGWPLLVDTAVLYSPLHGRMRLKLKSLAEELLRRRIQAGRGGHDAGEDALATLDLCTLYFRAYGIDLNSCPQSVPDVLLNRRKPFCLARELLGLAEAGREGASAWHLRDSAPRSGLRPSPRASFGAGVGTKAEAGVASADLGPNPPPDAPASCAESAVGAIRSPLTSACAEAFTEVDVTGMDPRALQEAIAACFPAPGAYSRPLILWSGGDLGEQPAAGEELLAIVSAVDGACPPDTACIVLLQGPRSCQVLSHVTGGS